MRSLRRMFGGIKVNENWRKRCNKEIMQLFGDSDIISLVGKVGWIEFVMLVEREVKKSDSSS
jgi:hypothetical protein